MRGRGILCQVRSSTTDSKRTFLQKKGLTEGEIDDAFQRVPEASDTTMGPPAGTTSQLAEASRPQKPFPTASTPGPYQPYQAQTAQQQPQSALQPAGYRWSQVYIMTNMLISHRVNLSIKLSPMRNYSLSFQCKCRWL